MPPVKTVSLIGLEPAELQWVRALVVLLRHPDPTVGELARRALLYLSDTAERRSVPPSDSLDYAG